MYFTFQGIICYRETTRLEVGRKKPKNKLFLSNYIADKPARLKIPSYKANMIQSSQLIYIASIFAFPSFSINPFTFGYPGKPKLRDPLS